MIHCISFWDITLHDITRLYIQCFSRDNYLTHYTIQADFGKYVLLYLFDFNSLNRLCTNRKNNILLCGSRSLVWAA